jgi:hypothetical protein
MSGILLQWLSSDDEVRAVLPEYAGSITASAVAASSAPAASSTPPASSAPPAPPTLPTPAAGGPAECAGEV